MKAKVNKFEYLEPCAILEDIRLIFTNCERYNVPDAQEYLAGQRLCRHFVKRVKELGLDTLLTQRATGSSPKEKVNGGGPSASGSSSRRSGRRT